MIQYITNIPGAPKPIGPYSVATIAGDFVFLSGQVAIDPATGELVGHDIESQTTQVMKNLETVLKHLGLGFSHIVKSTIYLTDMGDFSKLNLVYEKWLKGEKPARATVEVSSLPKGSLVEIEMVAYKK